jgi:hypothetical protein
MKIVLDEDKFGVLLGHIRRTNNLIMAYPNAKREKQRQKFFSRLQAYAQGKLGQSALQLTQETNLLYKIERGFLSILELLERCAISKLSSDVRAAACISRAAGRYELVTRSFYAALKARYPGCLNLKSGTQ